MVRKKSEPRMESSDSYVSIPAFNPFPNLRFRPQPHLRSSGRVEGLEKRNEEAASKGDEIDGEEEINSDDDIGEEEGFEGDDESDGMDEVHVEEDGNRMGVDEEECEDFASQFAEAGKEDEDKCESDGGDSGVDICDDDKIPDPLSSDEDEDEGNDVGLRNETEEEGVYLRVGKTFNSKEDVKIAVLRYSLKSRYDIKLYISEFNRVGAKCSDTRCPWRMYCSYERRLRKMQIKVFVEEHTCVKTCRTAMLKQKTIGWLFEERLRKNPKLTPFQMVQEVQREYGFYVTEDQCSKAKSNLAKQRRDNHFSQFDRIWDYQADVLQSNRDSVMEIETIPGPTIGSKQRFLRLFMCFNSQRKSWKENCRPIIGLDGAFLKWDIRGHLLAAIGRDGDNRIVPIAWAVVEIENNSNWEWFIRLLAVSLDLKDGRNVAVISDKQKGLVNAVHSLLPEAEHRQCARHILENWKKDNHDIELQRIFWRIARSYTQGEFAVNMEVLRRYNPQAHLSLQNLHPETWARAFFRTGTFSVDVLNNLSESFNRTIRQARKKPLLDLLEDIRKQSMVRTEKRSKLAGRNWRRIDEER